jgi:hypothetical protein
MVPERRIGGLSVGGVIVIVGLAIVLFFSLRLHGRLTPPELSGRAF